MPRQLLQSLIGRVFSLTEPGGAMSVAIAGSRVCT